MELAAALHHSLDVGPGTHAGLRAQKSASSGEVEAHETHSALRGPKQPPPGERPGILLEPLPQRSDRSRRHFSGDTHPTPGLPVLAGAAGEVVDSSALAFLTRAALEERRKEEKKVEMKGKEAQKVKQEELLAWERVATRELDTPSLDPVRAPLGPGERHCYGAPEAAGPPQLGPICSHHRALQEEEEEEEEKVEKGTFLLLLLMTSLTILSSLSSAGFWFLPESTGLSDLWEMTFSTALCIWQSLVWLLGLPGEYNTWIIWEMTSGYAVFSSLLGSTVDTYFPQFTEALVLGSCDQFSSCSLCSRIQRVAWFDRGYKFCVSLRRFSCFFFT